MTDDPGHVHSLTSKQSPLWLQLHYQLELTWACESGCDSLFAQDIRGRWNEANWNKLTSAEKQLCVSVVSALEQASKAGS